MGLYSFTFPDYCSTTSALCVFAFTAFYLPLSCSGNGGSFFIKAPVSRPTATCNSPIGLLLGADWRAHLGNLGQRCLLTPGPLKFRVLILWVSTLLLNVVVFSLFVRVFARTADGNQPTIWPWWFSLYLHQLARYLWHIYLCWLFGNVSIFLHSLLSLFLPPPPQEVPLPWRHSFWPFSFYFVFLCAGGLLFHGQSVSVPAAWNVIRPPSFAICITCCRCGSSDLMDLVDGLVLISLVLPFCVNFRILFVRVGSFICRFIILCRIICSLLPSLLYFHRVISGFTLNRSDHVIYLFFIFVPW